MPDRFRPASPACRRPRVGLLALLSVTLTLSLVVESSAQRGFGGTGARSDGGFGGLRPGGGAIGRPPGVPFGIGGFGPAPYIDVEDDDAAPAQANRIVPAKQAARKRPPVRMQAKMKASQQSARTTRRSGFDLPSPGERRFVPDEVLLNVASTTSARGLDLIARRHRLTPLETHDFAVTQRRVARLRIDDGRPVATVIRSLRAEPAILGASANHLYSVQQTDAPDRGRSAQYALGKLRLTEAHALARGDSVRVAVIDTLIDARHPDLTGAIVASFNATGATDAPHPHGTGIAGVIAAHGKLTGAAPSVQILAVHAFGSRASTGTSMNILKGLDWAAASRAQIVNMSFAGPSDNELHTMLAAMRRKGIVLIAAVGNAGPSSRALYPAADPAVIAVTATDADDHLFDRANLGAHIAVAAPGVAILAAAPDDGYAMQSGTSFAAAQVSGVAALILERNRALDGDAVRDILRTTARDLGPLGQDIQFGAGLVDALAAVERATPKATNVSRSISPSK